MSELEIYQNFISWLGKTWWGLPESDQLMPLIKARYTPEAAAFLTGMPFSGSNLEDIAELKGQDSADLKPYLDELAQKGILFRREIGETVRYSLNDSYFVFFRSAFWPGNDDDSSRSMAPLVNKYYLDGFYDQYATAHAKGLRALPINQTIEDKRQILPYEDVVKVLDNFEYFTVSACPCRHRKNLDDDSHTCSYRLKIKPETCKACGLCVKRCPMDAIQLKFSEHSQNKFGKAPVLDNDLCLGCGVCVHKCPTDSLALERKEEIVDPPQDIRDYSRRFMEDRKAGVRLLRATNK